MILQHPILLQTEKSHRKAEVCRLTVFSQNLFSDTSIWGLFPGKKSSIILSNDTVLEVLHMILGGIALLSAATAALICLCIGAFAGLSWLWILPVSFLGSFLVFAGLTFLVIYILIQRVDISVPQEHDSKFFRRMAGLIVEAIRTLLQMRVHTRGLEKLPAEGRFMLVCNHINDMDPVTLLMYFNHRQLAFISKRENADMFLVGKLMHKIMCQLVNRENDREALKTILNCIRLIKEDEVSIGVFPEGYTSLDGLLHRFRHGVFKIALKTKVPIVICTLQNTNKIFKNAMRLKPTDVHLHLVDVLYPESFAGKTAVQVGEEVYRLMADDLGPELVLQYHDGKEDAL